MSYIVVFPGPDGQEQVVLCPTLDAATARAEDLRNRRGIADVRLGRVEPISFTFAPQYRVNLQEDRQAARPQPTTAPATSESPQPVDAAAAANEPSRVQPGELSAAEIAELVAIDEADGQVSADDVVIREVLSRRDEGRQSGLFGR